MANLGNAYALTLALYTRDKEVPCEEKALNIYNCVDVMEFGDDERKADLYAQLEETLTEGMPFEEAVSVIEAAMDKTERRYPNGLHCS